MGEKDEINDTNKKRKELRNYITQYIYDSNRRSEANNQKKNKEAWLACIL
ncbi:32681_t:CDS:2 [Gigaspora margarita]|uniref:32681_t:CDS:1 n=1 Tax=Gigaspora margarita TaxID=4874 RepID=A0ABN7UNU8_GIGMA|nr:32681_t:CDS:2 [Gigaspora margarita]